MKLRILFGLIISFALLTMFGCSGGDGATPAAEPAAQFTITATSNVPGTVTPSGAVKVTQGGSKTFAFASYSSNKFLSDVAVDGVSQGAVTTYTFANVTADHTINATFLAGLPTTATVTLATKGTLPVGSLIGTIEAAMTYPTDSEPIPGALAAPFSTPFVTPTSVVVSGVAAAGGFIFPQDFPGLSQNPDYYPLYATTAVGTVAMTLRYPDPLTPAGIGTGEFATVTFSIAQPTNPALPRFIPAAAGFGKERGFTLLNLSNQVIFGSSDSSFIVGPVIFSAP